MKQKICHDTSCPPYDSYCFYCSRSSQCDSEDFREVPEGSPETIHIDEIARQDQLAKLLKQEAIAFAKFCMANSCQDLNIDSEWVNEDGKTFTDDEFYTLYEKTKS